MKHAVIATVVWGFSVCQAQAVADEQKSSIHEDFLQVYELKEKIPVAVCDESVVLKAPSLEVLREGTQTENTVSLTLKDSESRLMGFLLGDLFSLVASEYLQSKVKSLGPTQTEKLGELKRKLALDVCTALVTPGKLRPFLQSKPSWLLAAARAESAKSSQKRLASGKFLLRIRDLEERFAIIGKNWFIAGWVEPREVESVWTPKRVYRRLLNLHTERTQLLLVMTEEEMPLGFLFVSVDSRVPHSVASLHADSIPESMKQKRAEIIRLLIEEEAMRKMMAFPEQSLKIKNLQEDTKKQISEFKTADPKKDRMKSKVEATLDSAFFTALKAARVNGSPVGFQLLFPDSRLEKIYQDFRRALARL